MVASDTPRSPRNGAGPPLWRRILDDLRTCLDRGDFAERFPTDRELMDRYDVSRHTVREAVRHLQESGLIERERGRGSRVVSEGFREPPGMIYSLFRMIEATGVRQESIVLSQGIVRHSQAAAVLERAPNDELVFLERIRLAGDTTLAYDRVWLPHEIGVALLEADFTHAAIYDELRDQYPTGPQRGIETVRPIVPAASEAAHLGITPGLPVLEIDRRTWCNGAPLEWRLTHVRPDRYAFRTEWSGTQETVSARLAPI